MGPLRLALDRPLDHPLCERIRSAGWVPIPYACTEQVPSQEGPPQGRWDAVLILSPAGARAILPFLKPGTLCLATGQGTAALLSDFPVLTPTLPKAEGLWDLLCERFPQGGTFLLVRGGRSRGYLETQASGKPWQLKAWVSHREQPLSPPPPLPEASAVLALSPLQAEVLAPLALDRQRFAWGQRTALAFAAAGAPATASCEPTPEALEALLAAQVGS
ncbi:MAG: hypothetical protein H6Q00_1139 [Holophagaceae bacterium]|nr:hypothetical protein [Holophagaceae bacterium]